MTDLAPGARHRAWVAGVFILALVLRSASLAYRPARLTNDVADYQRVADHLRAGDGWCEGIFDLPCTPLFFRGPAYPLFLAAGNIVLGPTGWPILLVQHVLGMACVALPLWLATPLLAPEFAVAAALVLAVDPLSVVTGSYALTEGVFVPLLIVALALAARAAACTWDPRGQGPTPQPDTVAAGARTRLWAAAGAGVAAGLSCLARPIAQGLVVPALLLLLHRDTRARALAYLLAFAATISPWVVRNIRLGIPGTAGGLGVQLLLDVAWHRIGGDPLSEDPTLSREWAAHGKDDRWITATVFTTLHDEMARGRDLRDIDREWGALARRMMAREPARTAVTDVKNAVHMLVDQPLSLVMPGVQDVCGLADARAALSGGPLSALLVITLWLLPAAVLLPLAALGLVRAWRARDGPLLVLGVSAAVILASTAVVTRPDPRYRLPLFPPLVVLAAAGAQGLWVARHASRP